MSDTNNICERCGFIGSAVKKTSTGAQAPRDGDMP